MRTSIVIAAHNEGAALWKTVRSCVETCKDPDYEILVADDASEDGSIEELARRFPRVQFVRHAERQGASPTKDSGARQACGDVLVFLDGHCKPEHGALERLVQGVEQADGHAIVTPAIPALNVSCWRNSGGQVGHGYSLKLENLGCGWLPLSKLRTRRLGRRRYYESPALIGCALAVGRELYEELQGFDPQMRAWGVEDLDFGLKCWLMGYPILHDPEAVVGHRFRARFDNYSVPYERLLVNQLRMARKQFTQAVWSEWVERCRARHLGRLADHPEGLWARAWQLFEEDRESVEQERAYLHSRRVRDEFWYAERFGLKWPRLRACGCGSSGPLGGGESGSFRVMTADPSAEPSASPSPPPGCEDHANGIIHRGWDHWAIPNREWNESGGILTTPTGARQNQVTDHVISRRSYPEGFVLEVQFRFDSTQGPLFPIGREAEHKHRPTFLGNSGIGIYGWRGGTSVIQLYEVQVTDCYAMSEAGTQRFLDQSQETRFLRMDFGAGNQRHMEKKDIPAGVLAEERTHLEPINLTDFKNAVSDGGADCLCAVVAGLPVSYFEDVYLDGDTTPFPDGEIFPRETFALWSGSEDEGTEDRSAVRKNPSECSTGTERISCRAMVQDDTAISI